MNSVRITRIATLPSSGTFGAVVVDGQPLCVSLEPYTRDNDTSISCIPTGQYYCKIVNSPKFGKVYAVTNVENRSNILFHYGNFDKDTAGCILLGESYSMIGAEWAISESKNAIREFMARLDDKPFILTITEAY